MFGAALGALSLLLLASVVTAQGNRQSASPGYAGRDACPIRCSTSGPNPYNWSVYHNLDQLQSCQETQFYNFNLHDEVDDAHTFHRIYACTSYGPDWANLPKSTADVAEVQSVSDDAPYEIGWWSEGGRLASSGIYSLSMQLRHYLTNGYGSTNKTVLLFGYSGQAAIGLYIGKGLQNEGVSSFALKALEDSVLQQEIKTSSMAMQLCQPGYDADHIFGFMATSNGSFTPVQNALKTWAKADCLSFTESKNITGPAHFTIPLVPTTNSTVRGSNATVSAKSARLSARADCRTIQVQAGDSCGSLAKKCGIADVDIIKYNSATNFCSTLKPLQHICCSSGTLPDFTPKPNPDGSCYAHTFVAGDSCSSVAAANGLTNDDLEKFNKNTWAWNGCSNVWAGTIACISTGRPPFPAPMANAVCGPQVPGTLAPTDDSDIAGLNPCPLNACCNVWGQCGITKEFCVNTGTGAPGTAKPGTNGCISNCGVSIIRGNAPETFIKLGYFEGYSFSSRDCLYQEALQIDASQYTHLHFAFGSITPDYEINVGDTMTSYEFNNFKLIRGPKRILSFGGWDFSNSPETYTILRQGVTRANRLKLATNIANFIKEHDLDGVDIDWEYPSAPDIPGIPPGSKDEGANYLAFLVVLKNLLQGKSVSIAAPASYWYLKGFPINQIGKIVDYIVYMTYDLHGQWDAQSTFAQPGCPSGMCLRSHVNLTETISALSMITKAGVPSNKVVVGVTSYGRSFAMAEAGCHTPECLYTGGPQSSNAAKGVCTRTAGYIANAEIDEILKDPGRINEHYVDGASNSNILVYDNTQWVGYMSAEIRESRTAIYKSFNMGGTTNWAIDLESYNDPPADLGSWDNFLQKLRLGEDPYRSDNRAGNWTELTCSDPGAVDRRYLTPSQRWGMLDCPHAWQDAIDIWKMYDRPRARDDTAFLRSISDTFNGPEKADCGVLGGTNCKTSLVCDAFRGKGTGAAAFLIWNSLVEVHNVGFHRVSPPYISAIQLTDAKSPMQMYSEIDTALQRATNILVNPALDDFENKFAPVPPPPDNKWLLVLIDLITLGTAGIGGFIFNSHLKNLSYFIAKPAGYDNVKDTTLLLIGQSTTLAKDLFADPKVGSWTGAKQDEFSNYLGETIYAWGNITSVTLEDLFDGSDKSIAMLTGIISDGKLIDGKVDGDFKRHESGPKYDAAIARTIFGFAIPAIWTAAGTFPFVIDSGYPCGTIDPLDTYLSVETMHATASCVDDKLYYLASPNGEAQTCTITGVGQQECHNSKFSAPPGIEFLNHGNSYKGVTLDDLIKGSVNTYKQNGGRNGGKVADPDDAGTRDNLISQDITTPGFIRMPVCSPDTAFRTWLGFNGEGNTRLENYPCSPQSTGDCADSTFEDQTNVGSPLVSDCLIIIKNIEGTNGQWTTPVVGKNQRRIADFGTCRFGVEATKVNGNVGFYVSAQDVVDIIKAVIQQFAKDGRVAAKGDMSCRGNSHNQNVKWGIY
ncbi:hypothetical protein McanCB56680_008038 [Microsporum canis]